MGGGGGIVVGIVEGGAEAWEMTRFNGGFVLFFGGGGFLI